LLLPFQGTLAQIGTRRTDPATGDFLVKILDPDGNLVELRVPAGNKVVGNVAIDVAVEADGRWRYRYVVRLSPSSPQALMSFDVPCARDVTIADPVARSFSRTEGASKGIFAHAQYPDRSVCEVVGGDLRAGDSLSVQFTVDQAPGFGEAHLSGVRAGPVWPGERRAENAVAKLVVDSLLDAVAGWAKVAAVVPSRSLGSLSTANAVFDALSMDLRVACGDASYIWKAGICNSLRAKLDQVEDAMAHGHSSAAIGQLGAFRHELDAQRGKAVSDLAYVDLTALAGLLVSLL